MIKEGDWKASSLGETDQRKECERIRADVKENVNCQQLRTREPFCSIIEELTDPVKVKIKTSEKNNKITN